MQINPAKSFQRLGPRGRLYAAGAVLLCAALATMVVRMDRASRAPKGPPPVPVTAERPVRQDVPVYLQGLGTVQAFNTVTLKVRVDGTLDTVQFTEGQNVKAGDVLAQIDPRPYRATLNQALAKKAQDESQLPSARRDLDRLEALSKSNFAAEQSIERQRATVAQLEAAVKADNATIERAQIDLGFTTIKAPIDGRIGLRQVDVGNVVHASDQSGLAVISQLHPIAIVFTLSADQVPVITAAMNRGKLPVAIYKYDQSIKLADGELLAIESTIDQATGTIRLKATSANDSDGLWPGESVRANLLLRTERQVLTLPETAVQRGPNGIFVYVVKAEGTAGIQPIEVEEVGQGTVIVTRGLSGDELVVMSGQSRLRPGAPVKLAESKRAADPAKGPQP
jgi:multidrug efflux system membrane fusion protein